MAVQHPTLLIGAAETDITPTEPAWLGGMGARFVAHDGETFDYSARNKPTLTIHDPLTLQAVYFASDDTQAMLLTADLIHPAAHDAVTSAVADACRLPKDAIFYSSSHNHNGPLETGTYEALLIDHAVRCTRQAVAGAQPATLEVATADYDRLICDRAEPWEPVPGRIDVVNITSTQTGKPICQIWNYACHPCSLSFDFNEVSADYPGVIRKRAKEHIGQDVPIAFLNGCSGNVQPIGFKRFDVPTRMYLQVPKGDFESVEIMGSKVAEAGLQALANHKIQVSQSTLRVQRFPVTVPIQFQLDEAQLEQRRANMDQLLPTANGWGDETIQTALRRFFRNLLEEGIRLRKVGLPSRTVNNAAIAIGDLAIVLTPFEAARQIGEAIHATSPFPTTLIGTTSIGFEGYLTAAKFYEREPGQRPYEAFGMAAAMGLSYTAESPGALVQGIITQLNTMRPK